MRVRQTNIRARKQGYLRPRTAIPAPVGGDTCVRGRGYLRPRADIPKKKGHVRTGRTRPINSFIGITSN